VKVIPFRRPGRAEKSDFPLVFVSLLAVANPPEPMEWTTERCLSLTDVLVDGGLLELATSRSRQSFAQRLAHRLNEGADLSDLADWIVEQAEVVELHATDEELQAAIDTVTADEQSESDDDGP